MNEVYIRQAIKTRSKRKEVFKAFLKSGKNVNKTQNNLYPLVLA